MVTSILYILYYQFHFTVMKGPAEIYKLYISIN